FASEAVVVYTLEACEVDVVGDVPFEDITEDIFAPIVIFVKVAGVPDVRFSVLLKDTSSDVSVNVTVSVQTSVFVTLSDVTLAWITVLVVG
ncbi:unnamed protein product, partial [Allacma fusca]